MKFDLKNKIDLLIAIFGVVLILTGAFLRFFKYLFTPETTKNLTLILIPEVIILVILFTIKIWRK